MIVSEPDDKKGGNPMGGMGGMGGMDGMMWAWKEKDWCNMLGVSKTT
jgi:hypothetical protein